MARMRALEETPIQINYPAQRPILTRRKLGFIHSRQSLLRFNVTSWDVALLYAEDAHRLRAIRHVTSNVRDKN
jgi:hypothetical protein